MPTANVEGRDRNREGSHRSGLVETRLEATFRSTRGPSGVRLRDVGKKNRSIFLEAAAFLLTMNATLLVERALEEDQLSNGRSNDALLILAKAYTQRSMWSRAEEHIGEILARDKKNLQAITIYMP